MQWGIRTRASRVRCRYSTITLTIPLPIKVDLTTSTKRKQITVASQVSTQVKIQVERGKELNLIDWGSINISNHTHVFKTNSSLPTPSPPSRLFISVYCWPGSKIKKKEYFLSEITITLQFWCHSKISNSFFSYHQNLLRIDLEHSDIFQYKQVG